LHSNKNLSGLPRKNGYGPLHSHRASTQATADFRFCCPNENVVDHHLRTSRCARKQFHNNLVCLLYDIVDFCPPCVVTDTDFGRERRRVSQKLVQQADKVVVELFLAQREVRK